MITFGQLASLKAIAKAATPGPWSLDRPEKDESGFLCGVAIAATYGGTKIYANPPGGQFPAADARHIAAFDPLTVISLIEALETRDS